MVDLIKQIEDIGWGTAIICFFLIICAIVTIVSGYKKALSAFGLHSNQSLKEKETARKISDLQEQIDCLNKKLKQTQDSIISKQEQYHSQSIDIRNKLKDGQDDLKEDIHSLRLLLEESMDNQNQTTIAILRSSLWRFHKDFTTQGFVTPDGLKTFREMGKVYEKAGGDDIYHEKLLPEVEELEIRYPNGSIYNPVIDNH